MEIAGQPLIEALLNPSSYPHPVAEVELVETHASWVLLAGAFAYKVKKPVDFGFLDFSSLEKRRHFCQEELRLNRRTAPQLYLDVVAIGGAPDQPVLGAEPALDYAVKMQRFPRTCQLDRMLEKGLLRARHIERFAERIAEFHRKAPAAAPGQPFGSPEAILEPVRQNFDQLFPLLKNARPRRILETLEAWSRRAFASLEDEFRERQALGFIRECHGDLHLANMLWLEDEAVLFDCIEFNENFRWIDVVNDIAFLAMDLDDRGERALGWRFLDRYLQATGDYRGLRLLRFYKVYRALVRAKVAYLRLAQEEDAAARARDRTLAESYLELAAGYIAPGVPPLLLTHGFSGSGKTSFVETLAPLLGAVSLHSDLERKRLHHLEPKAASRSSVGGGIYRAEDHRATYARLGELAATVLSSGVPVIVDATFLRQKPRRQLGRVADELRVPLVILDFQVEEAELRRRIETRQKEGGAVSEATVEVLALQLDQAQPLSEEERKQVIAIHPGSSAEEIAGQVAGRVRVSPVV